MSKPDFTEPTTVYWQALHPSLPAGIRGEPPFRFGYPVRLPSGETLVLPLRRIPGTDHAVASLIANQAAFPVLAALADAMAALAAAAKAELVIGVPTLGLAFAPLVAERLGHARYVPLGYSRKYWYDDALSEPVASITSPGQGKRVFLDPNLRPLLSAKRVVLVDDAISTGTTMAAVLRLIRRLDVELAGVVVAMKQTNRWQAPLAAIDPELPRLVRAVYGCPMFALTDKGWMPMTETMPDVP